MNYSFDKLGADVFENMVQSLIQKQLGINTQIFGDGPDGQREACIENGQITLGGNAYTGKMFFQMKFKEPDGNVKDWDWLRAQLKKELDSFRDKKEEDPDYLPEVWIFFTNVSLTPVKDIGLRDKANKFVKDYLDVIPQIVLCGPDEIKSLLDNNREVATAYASFILPGDILLRIYDIVSESEKKPHEALINYAKSMLRENRYARLTQAGDRIDTRIDLSDIYVDMNISMDRISENSLHITEAFINIGNEDLRHLQNSSYPRIIYANRYASVFDEYNSRNKSNIINKRNKYIVIADAGQGKSTFCQYLCQMYRASFISSNHASFIEAMPYLSVSDLPEVSCRRYPFHIELRKYAGWIKEQDGDISVLAYLTSQMNRYGTGITKNNLEKLLESYSWLFIFDGLDEVPVTANRDTVLEQVNQFTDFEIVNRKCDALIICTSRPQGYSNDFSESEYTRIKISHMSNTTARQYLEKLLEYLDTNIDEREEHKKILTNCMNDKIKSKLMETPLQITIMAIIVKTGGTPPNNRYLLFSEYVETIIKREKQRGLLPKVCGEVRWIRSLHGKIAFKLQWESAKVQNISALWTYSAFKEYIIGYLENESDEDDIIELADEIYNAIMIRLAFMAEIEDSKAGFLIRSIQEYFAAEYIFDEFSEERIVQFLTEIASLRYWCNIFLFAAGYIAERRKALLSVLEQICHELNGSENLPGEYSISSIIKQGSYLAIEILSDCIFVNKKMQTKYLNIIAELLDSNVPILINYFTDNDLSDKLNNIILEKYVDKAFSIRSNISDLWPIVTNHAIKGNTIAQNIFIKHQNEWSSLPKRFTFYSHRQPISNLVPEPVLGVIDIYVRNRYEEIEIQTFAEYYMTRFCDTPNEIVPYMFYVLFTYPSYKHSCPEFFTNIWRILFNSIWHDELFEKVKIQEILQHLGIEEYIYLLEYVHQEETFSSFMNIVKIYSKIVDPIKRKYAFLSLAQIVPIHKSLSIEYHTEAALYDYYINGLTEAEFNLFIKIKQIYRFGDATLRLENQAKPVLINYWFSVMDEVDACVKVSRIMNTIIQNPSIVTPSIIRFMNEVISNTHFDISEELIAFYLQNINLVFSQKYGPGAIAHVISLAPARSLMNASIIGMLEYDISSINNVMDGLSPSFSAGNLMKILKVVDFSGGCSSLLQLIPLHNLRHIPKDAWKSLRNARIHVDYKKASNRLEEVICLFYYIITSDDSTNIDEELERLKQIIITTQDSPGIYYVLSRFLEMRFDDAQIIRLITHMASYLDETISVDPNYLELRSSYIYALNTIQLPLSNDITHYIENQILWQS